MFSFGFLELLITLLIVVFVFKKLPIIPRILFYPGTLAIIAIVAVGIFLMNATGSLVASMLILVVIVSLLIVAVLLIKKLI